MITLKNLPFLIGYFKYQNKANNRVCSISKIIYTDYSTKHYPNNIKSTTNYNENIITVPLRLKTRLDRKLIRDNSKYLTRKREIENSRRGSTNVVLSCRKSELNHFYGQSYSSKEAIPLISEGWHHRKSASSHDFMKLHAFDKNYALAEPEDETSFSDLGLDSHLIDILNELNIKKPTAIQKAAISKILKNNSCILSSETGSGKTFAYLLPLLQKLFYIRRSRNYIESFNSPLAIILAPSRELAEQIYNLSHMIGEKLDISVKLLEGGNIKSKIANPASSISDIIVSTLNVISHLSRVEVYSMNKVDHVVLDEADTFLDDSFSNDLTLFLKYFPFNEGANRRVQLSLVSATIPRDIETILNEVIAPGSLINITTPGLHKVMAHVPQIFLRLKKLEKPDKIVEILKTDISSNISTIVFCNKGETCYWLSNHLKRKGIENAMLSGKIPPSVRKGIIDTYLNGDVKVLVCTDVASRGIDTLKTGHIINYDFPSFMADYIHRCGRTGRVGSKVKGKVTSFISWATEVALVQEIELSIRQDTSLKRVDANIKRLINKKYGYGMNQIIV